MATGTRTALHVHGQLPTTYRRLLAAVARHVGQGEREENAPPVQVRAPEFPPIYTQLVSVAGLDAHDGIRSRAQDPAATLLFSHHWACAAGIVAGTDCGDLLIEAVHAPWQAQLTVLGSNVPATPVSDTVHALVQ